MRQAAPEAFSFTVPPPASPRRFPVPEPPKRLSICVVQRLVDRAPGGVQALGQHVDRDIVEREYVPQIAHLIRAHCSAGISRLAFAVWLVASVLVIIRAVALKAGVFIALGGIQILATAIIVLCATRYKDMYCPSHLPHQLAREQLAERTADRPDLL